KEKESHDNQYVACYHCLMDIVKKWIITTSELVFKLFFILTKGYSRNSQTIFMQRSWPLLTIIHCIHHYSCCSTYIKEFSLSCYRYLYFIICQFHHFPLYSFP